MDSAVEAPSSAHCRKYLAPATAGYLLAVIVIMQIFSLVDRSAIAVMVPEIKRDLSLSDFQISLIQGLAFSIFYSTAGLYIAGLVDRFPRRPIMFAGMVLWSLAATCTGLARGIGGLFAARMGVGFGETSVGPCATSMFADGFSPRRLGRAIATYNAAGIAGLAISLAIAGWMLTHVDALRPLFGNELGTLSSWRLVLILLGAPGLLVAFLAFTVADPARGPRRSQSASITWSGMGKVLIDGRGFFARLLVANGLITMVGYSTIAWAPTYARRTFGFSAAQVGTGMGLVVGVVGVISALLMGFFIDRFYARGTRDAAILLPALALLISWPLTTIGYVIHGPMLFIAAVIAIQCCVQSQYGPLLTAIQMASPSLIRGRAYALFTLSSNFIGVALGPMAVGALTDFLFKSDMSLGYSLAVLDGVCTPVAVWLLLRTRDSYVRLLNRSDFN